MTASVVVSAVAAVLAAIFSAATLIVAGRREHRRWLRDAMTDALVVFIGGSFAGAGQRVLTARQAGLSIDDYSKAASEAHAVQTDALTRLRLVALPAVILAAEALHECDHDVRDAVFARETLPSLEEWTRLRAVQNSARDHLLNTSRRTLGLGKGAPIRHSHTQGGWQGAQLEP